VAAIRLPARTCCGALPRASEPDPEAYQGRLVLLVDRATWSAGEDFVMPFADNGRATLVGETTGGSTGQPYYHTFDNGMGFAVGTKRAYLPDGGQFEGVGLAPDVAVRLRRGDLYAGRDPVLDRAIRIAKGEEE
jgi:carboxyl-terminal processing protease